MKFKYDLGSCFFVISIIIVGAIMITIDQDDKFTFSVGIIYLIMAMIILLNSAISFVKDNSDDEEREPLLVNG
jgi:intracellular septation protein A